MPCFSVQEPAPQGNPDEKAGPQPEPAAAGAANGGMDEGLD
jgi:hypothetical protein